MSTPAQQLASRANSLHSTGPRTEDGKAASSRNHTTLGLYTRRDFVLPHETELYEAFRDGILEDLAPATPNEQAVAAEIVSAQWRLRRCAEADADSDGAPDNPATARARMHAINIVTRLTRELRQVQTNRVARAELIQSGDPAAEGRGLADERQLVHTWIADDHHKDVHFRQMFSPSQVPDMSQLKASASNCTPRISHTPGRNSLCPCGSGIKYKKCCLNKTVLNAARA
jgi:hypothetical protein